MKRSLLTALLAIGLVASGLTFAAGNAVAATNDGTMAFGTGSGNIDAQAAAGVKPDYSTFWVGPWTLDSWAGPNDWFERTQAKGVTPAVHLYYWGDDISPSCVEYGCWSDIHNTHKSREEWQKLTQQLVDNLWKTMDGDPVVVFLETEFNQNGIGTDEDFDRRLADKVHFIKNHYPAAEVVIPYGNWRNWDWHTFDRAVSAADYAGLQGMRGSTQDSWNSYHHLYEDTLDGVQKLESLFGEKIFLHDIALSSYPEPDYLDPQANELRDFFEGMGELKAAGVEAMVYRSWYDSPHAHTGNYYGEAERHWGVAYPSSGDWKPAATVWVDGVQAERSGGSTSSSGSDFSADFSPKSQGEEWWVEVDVAANQGVHKVEARVDGGSWRTLEHKSWGSWAKSFHVPTGSSVDFRATSSDGQTATSQAYTWGGGSSGTTSEFSPDFTPKSQGNEWWVEVDVDSDQAVHKVEARVDGGSWQNLDHKDWGNWAKSLNVPSWATVEFRATASDGQTATSEGYVWSEDGGTTSAFDASFSPKSQGNVWWVEVDVDATQSVHKVEARVDGGHWRTLDHQDWGSWAKSFEVDGRTVEFRATSSDGQTVTSDSYVWNEDGGTSSTFAPSFHPKAQGNDWWVEVGLDTNHDVHKVEARVDNGHWRTLDHQDWGNWAKSFQVDDGSEIQFRATNADGQTATSSGYSW